MSPDRRAILTALAAIGGGIAAGGPAGATTAPASGYADVEGLRVYYEVHGGDPKGSVTPVLLLHGGMLAIETGFPNNFLGLIAAKRPVIAVEQQGHGHTGDRPGPITLDRAIADTSAVLRHLGVAKAHVMGHSFGGMIATGMAIQHPEQTASLTAIGATYRLEGMLPELVEMQRNPNHQPSAEIMPLLPGDAAFAAWKAHYDRSNPTPANFENVLARMNAMLSTWPGWTEAQLGSIAAPTLIAIGDNDFTRVEHAADMRRLIPGAQLAVLPGTTHMHFLDHGAWLLPMFEARIAA